MCVEHYCENKIPKTVVKRSFKAKCVSPRIYSFHYFITHLLCNPHTHQWNIHHPTLRIHLSTTITHSSFICLVNLFRNYWQRSILLSRAKSIAAAIHTTTIIFPSLDRLSLGFYSTTESWNSRWLTIRIWRKSRYNNSNKYWHTIIHEFQTF